jgi:oligopeptide transport system substrate-binding protein
VSAPAACALAALGLAALGLAACTAPAPPAATPPAATPPAATAPAGAAAAMPKVGVALAASQELTRAMDAGGVRSLDPSLATDVPAERVLDDIFEGLTRLDVAGEPAPGMAERWETSGDGLEWIFHLRAARWSNGAPLRAQDFVYAWRRTLDPRTASDFAQVLVPLANALAIAEGKADPATLGVTALDDRTLRVRLAAPTPYLLALLSKTYMVPQYEPAIRAWGERWTAPGHIVSNGAFLLGAHVLGGRISLARNPGYWDAAHVRLTRVSYLPLDRAVQTDRFFAGDLQFTDSFSAEQTAWLRQRLGTQVVSGPYLGNFVIGVNVTQPPFKGNLALRRALTLAVDRETLVKYVRQGLYQAAYTPTPPLPGYAAPLPAWARLADEARHALARRYYAEAGYSAARPLRVPLYYPTDTDNRRTFEAVAAMWRENLGAEVATYNEEFRVQLNERHLHKLPLFHYAWIGDFPDPYTFLQLFRTGFGYNDGGYSSPRYDALLDAAGREPDAARRYALLAQAEAVLDEDVAAIPLYYYASRHLVKPWVRGWQGNIQDRNLSQYMYLLEHEGR